MDDGSSCCISLRYTRLHGTVHLPAGADGSGVEGHPPDLNGCLEAFLVKGSLEIVSLPPGRRGEPQPLRPFEKFRPRACDLQLHDPGFSREGFSAA